ncbi:TPA: hypothetical protein NES53_000481 [Acinetobacter baumannii]|uniref:Uncharacterized protein n=1 Tax=Acinetobacter baumannii TaxID=470 RepID=A0A335FIR8_ACIBA|nr:hypothetical protein [Acinetobacter baumannii]SST19924.1 Uncharacterised protein [Acinetobacter baumannii]HAV4862184.1 hypothetical protein [Acinetobacter baumannii]HCE0839683.1 hypothetical protein [Acinetobacter baumannii]
MNAQQLLKYQIIKRALEIYDEFSVVVAANFPDTFGEEDSNEIVLSKLNEDNIDLIFDELEYDDAMQDGREEVRCTGCVTDLKPKNWSRHFEIDAVAKNINGTWVAWDYYYGGGKYSEPESIEWIGDARIVNCEEVQVMKTEYYFSEVEA